MRFPTAKFTEIAKTSILIILILNFFIIFFEIKYIEYIYLVIFLLLNFLLNIITDYIIQINMLDSCYRYYICILSNYFNIYSYPQLK